MFGLTTHKAAGMLAHEAYKEGLLEGKSQVIDTKGVLDVLAGSLNQLVEKFRREFVDTMAASALASLEESVKQMTPVMLGKIIDTHDAIEGNLSELNQEVVKARTNVGTIHNTVEEEVQKVHQVQEIIDEMRDYMEDIAHATIGKMINKAEEIELSMDKQLNELADELAAAINVQIVDGASEASKETVKRAVGQVIESTDIATLYRKKLIEGAQYFDLTLRKTLDEFSKQMKKANEHFDTSIRGMYADAIEEGAKEGIYRGAERATKEAVEQILSILDIRTLYRLAQEREHGEAARKI